MARDQSVLAAAAKKSLASQTGRTEASIDSQEDIPHDNVLSPRAESMKKIMENLFFDLPEGLPDWEVMKDMSHTDCIAVINMKIERIRSTVGDGSESEAFQKATTPVSYNLPQIDDRLAQLHSASFLRAPLSEPVVYWHLLGKKHAQVAFILISVNKN